MGPLPRGAGPPPCLGTQLADLVLAWKAGLDADAARFQRAAKAHGGDAFVFAAHVGSQYLLRTGLDEGLLRGVLDNNPARAGRRLAGFRLSTARPADVLTNATRPLVLLRQGVYDDEIEADLRRARDDVEVLRGEPPVPVAGSRVVRAAGDDRGRYAALGALARACGSRATPRGPTRYARLPPPVGLRVAEAVGGAVVVEGFEPAPHGGFSSAEASGLFQVGDVVTGAAPATAHPLYAAEAAAAGPATVASVQRAMASSQGAALWWRRDYDGPERATLPPARPNAATLKDVGSLDVLATTPGDAIGLSRNGATVVKRVSVLAVRPGVYAAPFEQSFGVTRDGFPVDEEHAPKFGVFDKSWAWVGGAGRGPVGFLLHEAAGSGPRGTRLAAGRESVSPRECVSLHELVRRSIDSSAAQASATSHISFRSSFIAQRPSWSSSGRSRGFGSRSSPISA